LVCGILHHIESGKGGSVINGEGIENGAKVDVIGDVICNILEGPNGVIGSDIDFVEVHVELGTHLWSKDDVISVFEVVAFVLRLCCIDNAVYVKVSKVVPLPIFLKELIELFRSSARSVRISTVTTGVDSY
jgi:hypothetical protein